MPPTGFERYGKILIDTNLVNFRSDIGPDKGLALLPDARAQVFLEDEARAPPPRLSCVYLYARS